MSRRRTVERISAADRGRGFVKPTLRSFVPRGTRDFHRRNAEHGCMAAEASPSPWRSGSVPSPEVGAARSAVGASRLRLPGTERWRLRAGRAWAPSRRRPRESTYDRVAPNAVSDSSVYDSPRGTLEYRLRARTTPRESTVAPDAGSAHACSGRRRTPAFRRATAGHRRPSPSNPVRHAARRLGHAVHPVSMAT